MDGWVLCLATSKRWYRYQKVTRLEKVKGRSERVKLMMMTMILKNQFVGAVREF